MSPEIITPVVRGMRAEGAAAVRFDVDFAQAGSRTADGDPIERARAEAQAAGYAQGWAQGQHAARAAAQAALDQTRAAQREHETARSAALQRALSALVNAADRLAVRALPGLAEVEDLVLGTAVELAEALLGREIEMSTDPVRDALHRALALTPSADRVTVRLNPADLAELTGRDGEQEHSYQGRALLLCPDATVGTGDAIAESGATTVDARLCAAVARMREVLGR